MDKTCYLDLESRSGVDLKTTGLHVYAKDISTDLLCVAYAFDDEDVEIWIPPEEIPSRLKSHILSGGRLSAWNAQFEHTMLNSIATKKYGWPEIKIEQLYCTMVRSYAMGLPGALANAAPALGLDIEKDALGQRIMLQLAQPREVSKQGQITWWDDFKKYETLYNYCKQDVRVEREISKKILELSDKERKVWLLDQKINNFGVRVDIPAIKNAIEIAQEEKARLDIEIKRITNNAVSTCQATIQIIDYLKKELELSFVDSIAKDKVRELLLDERVPEKGKRVLKLRQESAKSSVAKYQAMLDSSGGDGRVRGILQYHAATTGRWGGRKIQVQNFPRPHLPESAVSFICDGLTAGKFCRSDLDLLYGQPLSVLSSCLRGMLIPSDGMKFVGADFSSIEARVLAWLAGEEKTLNIFKSGGDIYKYAASAIFHKSVEEITDNERQIGKVAVLALGYQGGKGAFKAMAKTYGVDVDDDRAEAIKENWRGANKKIVDFWFAAEGAAKTAVFNPGKEYKCGSGKNPTTFKRLGSFLWCRLPSGRVICYPYPKVELSATPWGNKDLVTFMTTNLANKFVRESTYGGKLVENITQAVARDVLVDAMIRIDDLGIPIVMTVHDELLCEFPVETKRAKASLESLMQEVPLWAKGLPIEAKAHESLRYGK